MPSTKRGAPRAPKTDATTIAKQAAADKARKAASKKALAAALAPVPTPKPPTPVEDAATVEARKAEYAANALRSAQEDAAATGLPVEAILADMGLNEDGTPRGTAGTEKQRYSGPMLALVAARKSYRKMPNGNPACGDTLSTALGGLTCEAVCKALIQAMALPGNPYSHLNPGQQSMNLRNKARGMLKNGTLTMSAILEAARHAITA